MLMLDIMMVMGLFRRNRKDAAMASPVWNPQNGDKPQKTPTPNESAFSQGGSDDFVKASRITCLKFFF